MKYFLRSLLIGLLCLAPTLGSDATQRVAALVSPQAINVDLGFVQVGNVGNLSVMGAPSGATFSLLNNPGGHFSIVGTEIVADPSTPAGQYSLSVKASGTGYSVNKTFVLNFSGSGPPPGTFAIGGTISGLENSFPAPPLAGEVAYQAHKNLSFTRLPLGWGGVNTQLPGTINGAIGIQPTPFAALDTTSTYLGAGSGGYLGVMDSIVSSAVTNGMDVILDIHTSLHGPGLAGTFAVSSLTSSGTTTVTATASASANLVNGATVTIAGASPSTYNGSFVVFNVTGTTFQYLATGPPASSPATGTIDAAETAILGTPRLPCSAFADLWTRIATHYKTASGIRGYDLMNEPPNGADFDTWFACAQGAITAIRATGDTHTVYAEGVNFSGAWNWVTGEGQPSNNANLYLLNDPLDGIIFSAHSYLDNESCGCFFVWSQEIAKPGLSPPGIPTSATIGTTRLTPFVEWCSEHQLRCHIGETGTSNDPIEMGGVLDFHDWNASLQNELSFAQANNLEVNVWGAGPGFGPSTAYNGYPLNYEPSSISNPAVKDFSSAGLQATQMVVLDKFSGFSGAQPTAYAILPPVDGSFNPVQYASIGTPTGNFTVQYNGLIPSGGATITPHDFLTDGTTSAGGSFTPASVTLAAGDNGLATFTYTPSQAATIQVVATNNKGWTNPPPFALSSINDVYRANSISTPSNVYGMYRRYTPYVGSSLLLQRSIDNAQMAFPYNNLGNLPRAAMQTFASSDLISLVQVFDQSPNGNTLTFTPPFPTLNLQNAAGYPEIECLTGCTGTFNTPVNGQTAVSVIARMNQDASAAGGLWRIDWFTGPLIWGPSGGQNFQVWNTPGSTIIAQASLGIVTGAYHDYGTTYASGVTNGLKTYLDSSLNAQVTPSQTYTLNTGGATQAWLGFFRFGLAPWKGSFTNLEFEEGQTLTLSQMAAIQTMDATYYSTPLPDTLPPINPVIGGTGTSQVTAGFTSAPFLGATVQDNNPGTPTDTVTITLTGSAGGTLTGTGLTGSGPYTLAAAPPATITTELRSIIYTPAGATGSSETMTLLVSSSAGTSTSDSNTVVSVRTALNPVISGTTPTVTVVGKSSMPFVHTTVGHTGGGGNFTTANILVTDPNGSTAQESVTITLTGSAAGSLTGTGLSGSGPYTMAAAPPATITSQLQSILYNPGSSTATQTQTLSVLITSSAGTTASDSGTIVTVNAVAPAETPFPVPGGTFTPVGNFSGVNIAAAENGYPGSRFSYIYPQPTDFTYWAGKGFGIARMPITRLRLQPDAYGPLDPPALVRNSTNCPFSPASQDGFVGRCDEQAEDAVATVGVQTNLLAMKQALDNALAAGQYVMIDLHDFGGLKNTLLNYLDILPGQASANGTEGTAQLVDVWQRLATKFKNYPNVMYDVMNEPNGQTPAEWFTAQTAVNDAIAAITTAHIVFIEGSCFTGAHNWVDCGNGAAWAGYVPPAGLQVVYEMHEYLDNFFEGGSKICLPGNGSAPMAAATAWGVTNGVKIFIGESGWSQDASCPPVATQLFNYLVANDISNGGPYWGYSYWTGGSYPFYGAWNNPLSYMYSATPAGQPGGPYVDSPQEGILHSNILNFLLKRDIDPASNDNDPVWLEKAA